MLNDFVVQIRRNVYGATEAGVLVMNETEMVEGKQFQIAAYLYLDPVHDDYEALVAAGGSLEVTFDYSGQEG